MHDYDDKLQQPQHTSLHTSSPELEAVFNAITDGIFIFNNDGYLLRSNKAGKVLLALDKRSELMVLPLPAFALPLAIRNTQGHLLTQDDLTLTHILAGTLLTGLQTVDIQFRALDGQDKEANISAAPVHDAQGMISGAVLVIRDTTARNQLERRASESLNAVLAMAETLILPRENVAPPPTSQDDKTAMVIGQQMLTWIRSMLGCQRAAITLVEPDAETLYPFSIIGASAEQEQWWRTHVTGSTLEEGFTSPTIPTRLRQGETLLIERDAILWSHSRKGHSLTLPLRVGTQLIGLVFIDYGTDNEHTYTQEERDLAVSMCRVVALIIEHERLLSEQARNQVRTLAFQEARHRMEEFISIVSHELRTPLTAILGNVLLITHYLQHMQQHVPQDKTGFFEDIEEINKLIERTERQAMLQNRLVNDLLDVSRIQSNTLQLQLQPCDLVPIVREIVYEQRLVAPTRTIHLKLPDKAFVPIIADPDRIGQVITNYVTNALKYSPPDTPVEVDLEVKGTVTRLSVTDKGEGLSPTEQERIWEPFYRAERIQIQSGTSVGLGQGLHICQTLIEQHRGYVGVHSTPSRGSRFWFTLPIINNW